MRILALVLSYLVPVSNGHYLQTSKDLQSSLAMQRQNPLETVETASSHSSGRLSAKQTCNALRRFQLFVLALNPAATLKASGLAKRPFGGSLSFSSSRGGEAPQKCKFSGTRDEAASRLMHFVANTEPWAKLRGGDNSMQSEFRKTFHEGLKEQAIHQLQEMGRSITVMVAGEADLGTQSFMSTLFQTDLEWPKSAKGKSAKHIVEQTFPFDLDGVPFSARLIDTPGYGDVDRNRTFRMISRRLKAGFQQQLLEEGRIDRFDDLTLQHMHNCIDVVLYSFAPRSRCTQADIKFLKLLDGKTSIVPVLTKADSLSSEELASFREEVVDALNKAEIEVAHPPVAVSGVVETDSGPFEDEHELQELRQFLLFDGLLDLKHVSKANFKEWRMQTLLLRRRRKLVVLKQLLAAVLLVPESRHYLRKVL